MLMDWKWDREGRASMRTAFGGVIVSLMKQEILEMEQVWGLVVGVD